MVILAIALSLGLGLQLEPDALQNMPQTLKVLATSGILPAALIAIVLKLVLPEDLDGDATGKSASNGRRFCTVRTANQAFRRHRASTDLSQIKDRMIESAIIATAN